MRILHILTLIGALLGLAACSGSKADEPEAPRTVGRTLLIYMVAANDLGSKGYDEADLLEMELAAAQHPEMLDNNRVIVYQHDRYANPELKELTVAGFVTLHTYHMGEGQLSVDASQMLEVIGRVKALAPADDYGLVLWSHASGWVAPAYTGDEDTTTGAPQRAFGAEYYNGNTYQMRVQTLARVLEGQGFSFIWMDCCNMATAEVAYELRHAARRLVGSVTELPAEGMPYDLTLPLLLAAEPRLEEAAAATFGYYDAMVAPSSRWCTMSVIDLTRMDALAAAVADILASSATVVERSQVQRFMLSSQKCTLYDLADYMAHTGASEAQAAAFSEALKGAVTYAAATPRFQSTLPLVSHCGLGCYILQEASDADNQGYSTLQWYADVASRSPLLQP